MASYLVIVESPAKAKTINKYLGKNYTVIASMGHMRDLPKSQLGIDLENNYEPKYITISGMPIASGTYWNGIHGHNAAEAVQDLEGMYMMRSLARNMVFLMRSIALGKEAYGLPEKEPPVATNFIR